MNIYLLLIIAVLVFLALRSFVLNNRKKINELASMVRDLVSTNDEMKQTLALGLYHRYKAKDSEDEENGLNPLEFEHFVARIMQELYSSKVQVTGGSGDYGIDIEEIRDDGLYLGQVKCYASNNLVNFEPIAIVHSQMIKQGAKGGYVVTTSSFSRPAKKYAIGLGIELIEGEQLIDLWVKCLEKKKESLVPTTTFVN